MRSSASAKCRHGPGGQSVGQAAQFCLVALLRLRVGAKMLRKHTVIESCLGHRRIKIDQQLHGLPL